ncbi:hypothetical protein PspS35_16085 [Pseudomonas sp. S35]|uniref:hypothetical protein n=1 Tax=Pseudomonas sp. S35 TaxID=1573719 RepID=UPI00132F4C9E|nr:hypothetical protein [Pseudomonas sp. S35]QHF45229.1 hypothetical protein PspS35_16085 [Pseudomonas sp. S35]
MPAQPALIRNLLLNGSFSDDGKYWDTTGTVDYSRQSCRILSGQASQRVDVTPLETYTLSLWTQVLFKGQGELLIRPNPPATDERTLLDSFHVWTPREIRYTPPAGTVFITIALSGTAGEVYADEMHLSSERSTPEQPELIRNGDFSAFRNDWDASASPIGSRHHFDGSTFEATLMGQARQDVSLVANQTYEFSVRTRCAFGGTGFVVFHPLPSGTLTPITFTNSDWTLHTRDLVMPAGTTGCGVVLIGQDGGIFFDDVSMKLKT